MRSISYWSKRFVSLLAAGSLVGCAHQYAPEASFGSSVKDSVRMQSVRINGVGHDRIEPGFDGLAAKAVMDRYVRSYEQPQQLGNVLRLGVGGAGMGVGASAGTPVTAR
ncbi:MAG: hypothetical protein FGM22_01580 [Burkholderiaceae bacterium]|nr:hypothetical protein [Burkholderiaceae bacterium]